MSLPLTASALGEGALREILYLILTGEHASPLFDLARHNTQLARMERVLKHMHEHYQESQEVDQLAVLAGMSTSSFHRHFRQATGSPPLQYLKKLRLTRARELLQDKDVKVKQAAAEVGYESPTQFSREFKRYFGVPRKAVPAYHHRCEAFETVHCAFGAAHRPLLLQALLSKKSCELTSCFMAKIIM
ncbi:AraC family transcriptional regulator [Oceanimonas sp. NS1]|nr:AraC family transcriptional regulator [Oceanimonas sp. NS1]